MSDFLHGVRTIETLTGSASVIEVASSVIAVFGTSELAPAQDLYHTTKLEDAEVLFGAGSIIDAIRRVHKYVPSNSIISIPLGKNSDFPAVETPVLSGVSFSSASAPAFIDDGAGLPVETYNPKGYELTYSSDKEAVATVDAITGEVTPIADGIVNITVSLPAPSKSKSKTANRAESKKNVKMRSETKATTETHTYALTVTQTNPNADKFPASATLSQSDVSCALAITATPVTLLNPHGLLAIWSVDEDNVVQVNSATGEIATLAEGEATVTVTLMGATIGANNVAGQVLSYTLTVIKQSDALLAAFIKALPLLRKAKQRFGFGAKINIAPGILDKAGAASLAVGAIAGIRGVWLGDCPTETATISEAIAFKNQFTSNRYYLNWPRHRIIDSTGSTINDGCAAGMAGLIAQVDRNLTTQTVVPLTGYWCSPSNYVMADVVGPAIELDYIPNDSNCDVNVLNANGIASMINHGGWKNFGNYSTPYPSTTDPLNFLCWRRTMDIIEESIEDATLQYLDFPMFTSPTSIANTVMGKIRDTVNDYLRSKTGSALVYSSVSIMSEDNPLSELQQGKVKYRYKATPPVPIQTVEFEAIIYVEGLESAFNQLIAG